MPTYQYACTECGHAFEQVQSFSDHALTDCPQCGGRLRKVFNAVGVVFKGSGFYRTDSRAGSSASVPAGDGGAASPAAPASAGEKKSSGGDAKPAASGSATSSAS